MADDEDPYFATVRSALDGGLSGPDGFRVVSELTSPAGEGALTKSLAAKGVGVDRLESKGYGSSMPAALNDTPEGKRTNRRVELICSST